MRHGITADDGREPQVASIVRLWAPCRFCDVAYLVSMTTLQNCHPDGNIHSDGAAIRGSTADHVCQDDHARH